MATFLKRGKRVTAWVRKAGHQKSQTFATHAAAKLWARNVEAEIEALHGTGVRAAKGLTIADLIDKYIAEFYAAKPWGRSKSADLARLRRDLGGIEAAKLTSLRLIEHFRERNSNGAGGVTISAQIGYLLALLETAKAVWKFDVPVAACADARMALARIHLISKSRRRDRRVTDQEIALLLKHFAAMDTSIRMADLVRFQLASGMRISETCRLRWEDLNEHDRVVTIRDRKHPQDRLGNDQTVPLLNRTGYDAFAIVEQQRKHSGTKPRIFPYNSKSVSSYFTRACTTLGLKDVSLHDLRHEALSRLFESGLTIEAVALVSGHRDWSMLKRYVHLRAADLHEHEVRKKKKPRVSKQHKQRAAA